MKSLFLTIMLLFTISEVYGQPCGKLKVKYENKIYNTVQIGNQCWLRENLDVGTRINGSKDARDNDKIEKYCYADRESNCETYGGLYQWDEAMGYSRIEGAQGICPTGWHIPTYAEFEVLRAAVNEDANSLKAIGQGDRETGENGTGTNTSGFSALLSGQRDINGILDYLGITTKFWSSTEYYDEYAYVITLSCCSRYSSLGNLYKVEGFSVRCVKD